MIVAVFQVCWIGQLLSQYSPSEVTKLWLFSLFPCSHVSFPSASASGQHCVTRTAVRAGILVFWYFVRYFDGHFSRVLYFSAILSLYKLPKKYQYICRPFAIWCVINNWKCAESVSTKMVTVQNIGEECFVELCLPLEGLRFSQGAGELIIPDGF